MCGYNLSRSGLLSALAMHPCSHGMYDRRYYLNIQKNFRESEKLWLGSMDDMVSQHVLLCVPGDMLVDDVWCDNWLSCVCLYPRRIGIDLVPLNI